MFIVITGHGVTFVLQGSKLRKCDVQGHRTLIKKKLDFYSFAGDVPPVKHIPMLPTFGSE